MKIPSLQQPCAPRRTTSFRSTAADSSASSASSALDSFLRSPANLFWFVLHTLCCLISLILGFRFSRLVFFLLFTNPQTSTLSVLRASTDPLAPPAFLPRDSATGIDAAAVAEGIAVPAAPNRRMRRVVVGRHGIRIRPWPHPNPAEVMKAHRIIERVQREQRAQFEVKALRPVIIVTPSYVRTFQALHLTGVAHSFTLLLEKMPNFMHLIDSALATRPMLLTVVRWMCSTPFANPSPFTGSLGRIGIGFRTLCVSVFSSPAGIGFRGQAGSGGKGTYVGKNAGTITGSKMLLTLGSSVSKGASSDENSIGLQSGFRERFKGGGWLVLSASLA